MNINLEYGDVSSIDQMIRDMPKELEEQERVVLRKIGAVVKRNVEKFMVRSRVEARAKLISPSNYDGSRPYVHMKDDVKAVVKRSKSGDLYVSVRGGKYTGYKWAPVDNGHLARDGVTFVPGSHFIGHAVNASEKEVNDLIDSMVRKVVEND